MIDWERLPDSMAKHRSEDPKPEKPTRIRREYISPDGKSGAVTSSPSKKSWIERLISGKGKHNDK